MGQCNPDGANELAVRLSKEVKALPRGAIAHISRDLGVARNTIYNWLEHGNIPADKLLALADFGVDVVYVMTGERRGEGNTLAPHEAIDLDLLEVAEDAAGYYQEKIGVTLDPRGRAEFIKLIFELYGDEATRKPDVATVVRLLDFKPHGHEPDRDTETKDTG